MRPTKLIITGLCLCALGACLGLADSATIKPFAFVVAGAACAVAIIIIDHTLTKTK